MVVCLKGPVTCMCGYLHTLAGTALHSTALQLQLTTLHCSAPHYTVTMNATSTPSLALEAVSHKIEINPFASIFCLLM